MANNRLTNGVTYSVVGRYMNGSVVTNYHIIGEDGSQFKVSKNQLVRLIDQGKIVNCRVQMYNDKPILRGKGINLNDLPIYDEKRSKIKNGENLGLVKPRGKDSDPNSVFGQLLIEGRIMSGNICVGYVVVNAGGIKKRLSKEKVYMMAAEKQIGNARVQMYNNKPILRGVGISLDKLPSIQVNAKVKQDDTKIGKLVADSMRKVNAKAPDKVKGDKHKVIVSIDDLVQFGKRQMVINKKATKIASGSNKPVGLEEVKEGKARLYVQAIEASKAGNSFDEYITTAIKIGEHGGVGLRVVNRYTKEVVDIYERDIKDINEKILLGVMCCGLDKWLGGVVLGVLSIQSNDATSERVYQLK